MKTQLFPKILIALFVIFMLGAVLSTRPQPHSYTLARPALGPTETATATITPTLTITPTVTITVTVTVTPVFFADTYLPAMQLQPTPAPTATPACLPSPPIGPDDAAVEADTLTRINEQRSLNGLGVLLAAAELTQSSRRHSLDMALNHFTTHTGSDGSSPGDRVREACYDWDFVGEIIGWGFGGDTGAMVNWWMNSAPHRAAILSTTYQDFGAGYMRRPGSDWVHYWTVNFGRRDPGSHLPTDALYLCQYSSVGEFGGSSLSFLSAEPCPVYE